MKGIIYFKKWTRMPWFSRLYHIKNQSYNYTLDKKCREAYHLCLMAYQDTKDVIDQHRREYFQRYLYNTDEPLSTKDQNKLDYLIKVLFKRYPQMAQVTWGSGDTYSDDQNAQFYKIVNGLYRKYLKLLNSGYKKEVATEKVLKQFEDKIMLKIEEIGETENLAESQRGVSVMNYFLHQSLEESNNKMLRVKRDHEIQQFLKNDYEDIDNKFFNRVQNYDEPNEDNIQTYNSENFIDMKDKLHDYRQTYNYLFKMYYDDAFKRDNLKNLNTQEVLSKLRDQPNYLKKKFQPLVRQLFKNDIRLSESGEVDYSGCKDENIKRKFQKQQSLVKYALQLNDLSYGFVHRQNLKNRYHQIKKQIQIFNKEAREQIEQQQQEYLQKMKELKTLDISKLDSQLQFQYFQQEDLNEDNFHDTMKKMHMNFQQFLSGISPRIDEFNLQTLDQNTRNLLMESEWIKMKIERLDLIDQNKQFDLLKNYKKDLMKINDELRHLKLITDSKLKEKTQKIFFDEHRGVDLEKDVQSLDSLKDLKLIKRNVQSNQYPTYRNIDRILNSNYLKVDYAEKQDKNLTKKDSQDYFWNTQANEYLKKEAKIEESKIIDQYNLEKMLLTDESRKKYEQDIISSNEKFKNFIEERDAKLLLAKQEIERIEEEKMREKLEKQLEKKKSRKELRKSKSKKK